MSDAIELACRLGPEAKMIAGGTDLVIQMRRRQKSPAHLINIQPIEELQRLVIDDLGVTIGALVTHKRIEQAFENDARLEGLSESARIVGGHQVRNSGTIGGNLCNASPAADLFPILLVLDAEVELVGEAGSRREPLKSFLLAPGHTTKAPDEILARVRFPSPRAGSATAFLKAGRRRAMEISLVSVAAMISLDGDGRCGDVRIAVGAAAPTAFRAAAAESVLKNRTITEELLEAAGQAAADASSPLTDHRASAGYRRRLVATLTKRALMSCSQRIAA